MFAVTLAMVSNCNETEETVGGGDVEMGCVLCLWFIDVYNV